MSWVGRPPIGRPSNRTASGGLAFSPTTDLKNVDLPAPLAPMIATTSPGSTWSEMPKSAWKSR